MQKYEQVWKNREIWNMKLWLVPLITWMDSKIPDAISMIQLAYCFISGFSIVFSHGPWRAKGSSKTNSPVLQSARPRAVALASYTGVDKIIKSTVGFTRKDIWID